MLFGSSSMICVILINLFVSILGGADKQTWKWVVLHYFYASFAKNQRFQSSGRPFLSSPNPTFPRIICSYSIMDLYCFLIHFRHNLHTQANILVPYLLLDILRGRCTIRLTFVYPIFYVDVSEKWLSPKNINFFICGPILTNDSSFCRV